MSNDRRNVVNEIEDGLGREGSRELAEQIFDVLRADGRITYTDLDGLVVDWERVDLLALAVELIDAA